MQPEHKGLLVSVRIVATYKTQYGKKTIASRNIITSGAQSTANYLRDMAIWLFSPVQKAVFREMANEIENANRWTIIDDTQSK